MTLATETLNLAFYEATAQIIPVLFLALVVEERILGRRDDSAPALELVLLAAILVGAVGELVSLNALLRGEVASDIEQTAVVYAIVLLFVPFLWRAALPRLEALASTSRWTSAGLQLLIIVVTLGAVGSSTFDYDIVPVAAGFAVVFFLVAVMLHSFESDFKNRSSDD